jgi:hypothetical protein
MLYLYFCVAYKAAIARFSGFRLNDRCLRIEEIQDKPKRVRVPEKLVYYVVGEEKRSKDGSKNTLRKANNSRATEEEKDPADNPERPSRRHQKLKKPKLPSAASLLSQLNDSDKVSFERALRKGYVSITGLYRKNSSLLSAHRIWCNARDVPQMILSKAYSGRILDKLLIDFSTLSINHLSDDAAVVDEFMTSWKVSLISVALDCGMNLKTTLTENTGEVRNDLEHTIITLSDEESEEDHIESDRSTSLVFEGSRESSKDMVRQLASLWDKCRDVDLVDKDRWKSAKVKREKGERKK